MSVIDNPLVIRDTHGTRIKFTGKQPWPCRSVATQMEVSRVSLLARKVST